MPKQSLTLVELIISIALLGMIILAASTFEYSSLNFFQSSNRKVAVLNDLALIEEHIAKYTSLATGDYYHPGIVVSGSGSNVKIRVDLSTPPTPDKYADDTWVRYGYDSSSHMISFCSKWSGNVSTGRCILTPQVLTKRVIIAPLFTQPAAPNQLTLSNLTLRYNPVKSLDSEKNPEVSMSKPVSNPVTFSSSSYSIN